MARSKNGTPPAYPRKSHQGQARITVRLTTGKRHCLYLGAFGSAESRTEYQRVLAMLQAHGGRYPAVEGGSGCVNGLTLNELALAFWQHAEQYYRRRDGSPSRELEHFKHSLTPVLDLFGDKVAAEFGPVKLRASCN